jgi:hypothetical protein
MWIHIAISVYCYVSALQIFFNDALQSGQDTFDALIYSLTYRMGCFLSNCSEFNK